jgi:hypothetical protein
MWILPTLAVSLLALPEALAWGAAGTPSFSTLPPPPCAIDTANRSYATSYLLKLNAIWRLLQLGRIRSGIGSPELGLCIMLMVRLQLLSLLPMSPFGPHHRLPIMDEV